MLGGNIFHGELSLDQLFHMRPAPGYADYRTPIAGLYHGSRGTHAGGGVCAIPAYKRAARRRRTAASGTRERTGPVRPPGDARGPVGRRRRRAREEGRRPPGDGRAGRWRVRRRRLAGEPEVHEVLDRPCFGSLGGPGPADLAILAVSNARLEEQLRAAAAGARSAVVFASAEERADGGAGRSPSVSRRSRGRPGSPCAAPTAWAS